MSPIARYSYQEDEMMVIFRVSNSATPKNSGVTRYLISHDKRASQKAGLVKE